VDILSNFDITINGEETANKPMTSNSFLTLLKNCLTISRILLCNLWVLRDQR